jgi:hypothetical protein
VCSVLGLVLPGGSDLDVAGSVFVMSVTPRLATVMKYTVIYRYNGEQKQMYIYGQEFYVALFSHFKTTIEILKNVDCANLSAHGSL